MLNYAQHFTTGLAHSYWNIVEACPACPFPVRTFEHRRKWLKRQELRVTRLSAQPSLWIFFFSLIRHCSEHILNMFELFEDWVKFCIFCYEFGDEILSDNADGAPSCTESPELPEVLCCEMNWEPGLGFNSPSTLRDSLNDTDDTLNHEWSQPKGLRRGWSRWSRWSGCVEFVWDRS